MGQGTICIIGAGLAGLSAAFDLGRRGYGIIILESASEIGGLASSISVDGQLIERFYHFICASDEDLIDLVGELGVNDQLHWNRSRTQFFYQDELYHFGTPLDLLRFNAIPFLQRIRFGLNIVNSRYRKNWKSLDSISAYTWLRQQIGEKAYDVIWDPLLRVKFGDYHTQISAAWIWHRVNRVASSRRRLWEPEYLGYLERGSQTVIDALLDQLNSLPNVEIKTGVKVDRILTHDGSVTGVQVLQQDHAIQCEYVISTIALPVLLHLVSDFAPDYRQRLGDIDYLGVICGLLKLKKPVSQSFWMNINDERIPFNGFIEYTNLNKHVDFGGSSILYIPYYLPTDNERFTYSDSDLLNEFVEGLKLINSDVDRSWVEEYHISRAQYAQAVCATGFSEIVPDHQTPIEGLYITDSTQFYPEDRTISAAIRLGRKVAAMIQEQ